MNAKLAKRLRKEAQKHTIIEKQYNHIGPKYRVENTKDSTRGLYRHLKDIAKEIRNA